MSQPAVPDTADMLCRRPRKEATAVVHTAVGMLAPYGRLRSLFLHRGCHEPALLNSLHLLPQLDTLRAHHISAPHVSNREFNSVLGSLTRLTFLVRHRRCCNVA